MYKKKYNRYLVILKYYLKYIYIPKTSIILFLLNYLNYFLLICLNLILIVNYNYNNNENNNVNNYNNIDFIL